MVKVNTKFKVGDKVKILPSATWINVAENEVGKIATITQICSQTNITIKSPTKKYTTWNVSATDITPAMRIGQQLLLWEE